METRFAGSQRLDERRRRRLAVETEGVADSDTPRAELPAPAGSKRFVDAPDAESGGVHSGLDLAGTAAGEALVAVLVPQAVWKHAAVALAAFGLALGLLWIQYAAVIAPHVLVPALAPIVAPRMAAVLNWYGSLLLVAASQFALLIGWVRSHSSRDFDGRYHIWKKVAAAALLFSFCLSTGAHHAWSEMLTHYGQFRFWHATTLLWLLPAAGAALGLGLALWREMSDCRASLPALHAAAGAYLGAAAWLLVRSDVSGPHWHDLAQTGILVSGHLLLLLSMTLHARHVVFVTADPSAHVRRRLRIPRPHFNFRVPKLPRIQLPRPNFTKSRRAAAGTDEANPADKTQAPAGKAGRAARPQPAPVPDKAAAEEFPATASTPPSSAVPKPKMRIRLDTGHAPPSAANDAPDQPAAPPESPEPPAVVAADARAISEGDTTAGDGDDYDDPPARDARPPHRSDRPSRSAPHHAAHDAPADDDYDASASRGAFDGDDEEEDSSSGGNHRGLSKKQRRRLQQEQRDRDRRDRR